MAKRANTLPIARTHKIVWIAFGGLSSRSRVCLHHEAASAPNVCVRGGPPHRRTQRAQCEHQNRMSSPVPPAPPVLRHDEIAVLLPPPRPRRPSPLTLVLVQDLRPSGQPVGLLRAAAPVHPCGWLAHRPAALRRPSLSGRTEKVRLSRNRSQRIGAANRQRLITASSTVGASKISPAPGSNAALSENLLRAITT